jgi:haloacid dehalogenase-like hydrolase
MVLDASAKSRQTARSSTVRLAQIGTAGFAHDEAGPEGQAAGRECRLSDPVEHSPQGHYRDLAAGLVYRRQRHGQHRCGPHVTSWIDGYVEETGDDPVTITQLRPLALEPAEKVVWAAEPAVIAALAGELAPRHAGRLSVTITNDWCLEFTALGANKDRGMAAVARHLRISRDAVVAFGDGNNDATLLSWAGMEVAMPHGRPSARAAARIMDSDGDPESALARGINEVARRSHDSSWLEREVRFEKIRG